MSEPQYDAHDMDVHYLMVEKRELEQRLAAVTAELEDARLATAKLMRCEDLLRAMTEDRDQARGQIQRLRDEMRRIADTIHERVGRYV